MLRLLFALGNVVRVSYLMLNKFKICFHKYENLGNNTVTYIDEAWDFTLHQCKKCGKIKQKKEIIWRR